MAQDLDQDALSRIAEALERMAPAPLATPDFAAASGFVWHVGPDRLEPVPQINRVELDLLVGIERSRDTLLENTRRFAFAVRGTGVEFLPLPDVGAGGEFSHHSACGKNPVRPGPGKDDYLLARTFTARLR